jgi:hypothetical protein
MNLKDRITWLEEEHGRLNRLIDDLEKHTVPDSQEIHVLKKKRLQIKDELVKLQKQLHEEAHERLDWDE